jgi:hypothetical protein
MKAKLSKQTVAGGVRDAISASRRAAVLFKASRRGKPEPVTFRGMGPIAKALGVKPESLALVLALADPWDARQALDLFMLWEAAALRKAKPVAKGKVKR